MLRRAINTPAFSRGLYRAFASETVSASTSHKQRPQGSNEPSAKDPQHSDPSMSPPFGENAHMKRQPGTQSPPVAESR